MKRGILLIATGHRNYFRMAEVIAASIKVNNPDMPVCLASDKPWSADPINEKGNAVKLFDIRVQIQEKWCSEPIKPKVYMDKITPFQETIFMDVDQVMIMGRDLNKLFEECRDLDFTMSNTGKASVSVWADIDEINLEYGCGRMWNFHSELVYWKKSENAKKFFKAAQDAYRKSPVKSAVKFAGGHMSDELAFQLASIETGIYPHKENWTRNFWYEAHPRLSRAYPYQLTDYVTYSIGGRRVIDWVKTQYNTLAKAYFAKLGLSNPYQVVDKRIYLPERRSI